MEYNTPGRPGAEDYEPIRLTSDFVFKYVFGSETSTSILRSFLTAVQTDAGLPAVAEVEIRNPFNPAESYDAKTSVVDVRARDVTGTVYTVEVQALPEAAFRQRALYYWAQAYAGQLGKGQDYEQLSPVVGVNIVDFIIFPGSQPVHTTFELVLRHNGLVVLTDHLAIHFLELPKLERDLLPEIGTGTGGSHISTTLQRWLYYMHERGEVDAMEDPILLQILKEDPDIEDAEERYRQFVADDELREKYQDRIKAERDRRSQIIYARKQGLAEGRQAGLEQGLKEGREKGLQQGIEKGIEKGVILRQAEIVQRMKAKGMTDEEIAELTGLSVDDIGAITG
ncbi:MAG: Rpn family recombination-promoting nuclease/putative transposase [Alkalispirochaeta sp.]